MVIVEGRMNINTFSNLPCETASSAQATGFPVGALSQLCGASGSGKTEVVLRFLAENPAMRVAWVEESFSVYPGAFPSYQVSLDRIFFVDVSSESRSVGKTRGGSSEHPALWAVQQVLQAQIFGVVIVSAAVPDRDASVILRRMQLLAEKSRTTVIFLSETPIRSASWAIRYQAGVERDAVSGALSVRVLKGRGEGVWQHHSA